VDLNIVEVMLIAASVMRLVCGIGVSLMGLVQNLAVRILPAL
jgi:hypothetical protein